jgi:VCBS repeat-containing protein
MTVEQTGGVTEDFGAVSGNLTDSGTLSFTDVDVTDTHLVSKSYNADVVWTGGTLTAGQFTALTSGFLVDGNSWDYTVANAAVQFLGEGETVTFSYTVTVTDDSGQVANDSDSETVTITITGDNDAPILTVDTAGGVTEDAAATNLTDSGTLSFTDVDATDVVTPTATLLSAPTWSAGTLSTVLTLAEIEALTADFTIDGNGWDYTVANSLVQFLGEGETVTFSYTVTATDDSGQANNSDSEVVTITITGDNNDIVGTAGPDTALSGTEQRDRISGLGDNDILNGLGGADTCLATPAMTSSLAARAPMSWLAARAWIS